MADEKEKKLAKKGDTGDWVEKRTSEKTRIRVSQDQGKDEKKVHIIPEAAPKDTPSKPVPAKEVTLDGP